MGDGEKAPLRLQFNPKIQLEFRGATITSDAGLLAFRELDDALGLTRIADDYLQESRTGRNIRHHLIREWVSCVNRMQLTRSGCRFIVHRTPVSPTGRAISLIWEIQVKSR